MSNDPDRIKLGMHVIDVLNEAIDSGCLADPGANHDAHIHDIIDNVYNGNSVEDVELVGDQHHRFLRSIASNGDFFILRVDITDSVQQRRKLEDKRSDRLLSQRRAALSTVKNQLDRCRAIKNEHMFQPNEPRGRHYWQAQILKTAPEYPKCPTGADVTL